MPERAKHIISSYDAALYGLRNDVLMMSSLADRILQTAFEAFLTRNSELCDQVIAEDEEIDTLEKQVDQDGANWMLSTGPAPATANASPRPNKLPDNHATPYPNAAVVVPNTKISLSPKRSANRFAGN